MAGRGFFIAPIQRCIPISLAVMPAVQTRSTTLNTPANLFSFSHGNAKLPDSTLIFSIPAGHTCPGANLCLSMADRHTGKISDGPATQFRCYAASQEIYSNVRDARWRNLDLIKRLSPHDLSTGLRRSIAASRNHKSTHVRWFGSGDCFSPSLRDAIVSCAEAFPELVHYLYTKNLPIWLNGTTLRALPGNLYLTASHGGRFDDLLQRGLFPRTARVVLNQEEADRLGLPVDFNDSYAYDPVPTHFAHLVHGTQPAGSEAGKAIRSRAKAGLFVGYSSRRSVSHV